MRIGFLTALAEDPDDAAGPIAFRRFAGRSILSHQIDCALALGCEAVVCRVAGTAPEVIACQHRAEAAGLRFRAIETLRALPGVIDAADTVVVIADGLRPDPDHAADALHSRSAVPSFPAAIAVPRGFERIDAERAWAGVLAIRGDLVERLNDLPPDADAGSALLRIALQAGVKTVPLDPAWLDGGEWAMRDDAASLRQREARWISDRIGPASFTAPGLAVTERIGIRLAPDIIGTRLERAPFFVAVGAGVLAVLAGAIDRPLTGLLLCAVMIAAMPVAGVVARLSGSAPATGSAFAISRLLEWASDAVLVGLLALADRVTGGWFDLYLPAMLVGLMRLGQEIAPERWRPLLSDRLSLLLVLLLAAFFELLPAVLGLLSLLTLAVLFVGAARDRITTR